MPDWGTVDSLILISSDGTRAVDPLMIAGLPPQTSVGDYDIDGDVDGADYLVWQREFGTAVSRHGSGADGNMDGNVDAADYVIWRHNFAVVAESAGVPVPEPRSAIFAILMIWPAAWYGRTRRLNLRKESKGKTANGLVHINQSVQIASAHSRTASRFVLAAIPIARAASYRQARHCILRGQGACLFSRVLCLVASRISAPFDALTFT